ncbi:MAG TPA: galactokinase [Terriglobales bacterium]|nr:galactokinase [Terriglobales bacterium]
MDIESFKQEFRRIYRSEPQLFRAPGRVNLIGEHTDYNQGFVMPAAIDFYTWLAIAKRSDSAVNIRSDVFAESISLRLTDGLRPQHSWSDYVVGVIDQIRQSGNTLAGADILIRGEVPMGSGLSSSAAIEVAAAFSLLTINNWPVDRTQLALLCQRAENNFVGMRCGIMDQFISCNGTRDHALMLDCRSLAFTLLPLAPRSRMVICNTMVKHEHASGEYNKRRTECEEGVSILRKFIPGITSLRDVCVQQLERYEEKLPAAIYRRCRHVITENQRVQHAAAMLEQDDLSGFGKLMRESHASLRDDYEVSCRELDVMVEIATGQPGVYGSRMTGGGFGGCTINLVAVEHAEQFRSKIAAEYKRTTGLTPEIYISTAADGANQVG